MPSKQVARWLSKYAVTAACFAFVAAACGGTTGHEGLPTFNTDQSHVDAGAPAPDATVEAAPPGNGDDDDDDASLDGFAPGVDGGPPTTETGGGGNDAPSDTTGPCCTIAPACDQCIKDNCAVPNGSSIYPACSGGSGVQGVATNGPAAGSSRKDLCNAVFACVMTAKCGKDGVTQCYCGSVSGGGCLTPGAANGPCKDTIERGLETTDPVAIATGFTNMDVGGGIALELYSCMQVNCWDVCMEGRDQ